MDYHLRLPQFQYVICCNNAPRTHSSVDYCLPPQDGAWVQHHIAPNLAVISNNRSQLGQPSLHLLSTKLHSNLPLIQLQIRSDCPCRQMRPFPQHRIAHIVEVASLRLV